MHPQLNFPPAAPTLCRRCLKEQQRRWRTTLVQLAQSLAMAALIGGVFFQIGTTQASTAKRLPVLFFCCINQVGRQPCAVAVPEAAGLQDRGSRTHMLLHWLDPRPMQGVFGAMATVNSFPAERVLTLRERAAGMYFASAYFLAKTTAESAVYVVAPTLFSCIVYWMVGLQPLASKFVIFICFMVLCQLAAVSLAQAVSALCRDVDTSGAQRPPCMPALHAARPAGLALPGTYGLGARLCPL